MSVLCHNRRLRKPRWELADIFHRYLDTFLKTNRISKLQGKVIEAIKACRTAKLGHHLWRCNQCGYERKEYDSCRNRHCPKCQISNMLRWVKKRHDELLPIPYYHSVFTMPHDLNTIALYNKELIYDFFFKAVTEALNDFAQDPRFLGAKIGGIAILHTWGQTLMHHVHLHCIITGGGISNDGTRWVNLPYRKEFLFPVKAVSKRVRKRFAKMLRKAYRQGKVVLPDKLAHLRQPEAFKSFLDEVAWKSWYCYTKRPFAGPEDVVKYIGRYTHRVAISNHRLLNIEDGKVKFRYKMYQDGKTFTRIMSLEATEFIRRFLLHVIPKGFKRVRYFGFLANPCRTDTIELARKLLNDAGQKLKEVKSTYEDWFDEDDFRRCPMCQTGILSLFVVKPLSFAPG